MRAGQAEQVEQAEGKQGQAMLFDAVLNASECFMECYSMVYKR
jgi:hypothetical protein